MKILNVISDLHTVFCRGKSSSQDWPLSFKFIYVLLDGYIFLVYVPCTNYILFCFEWKFGILLWAVLAFSAPREAHVLHVYIETRGGP